MISDFERFRKEIKKEIKGKEDAMSGSGRGFFVIMPGTEMGWYLGMSVVSQVPSDSQAMARMADSMASVLKWCPCNGMTHVHYYDAGWEEWFDDITTPKAPKLRGCGQAFCPWPR